MRRWLALGVLALALTVGLSKASGEPNPNYIVTEPTDIWFTYEQPTNFVVETFMIQNNPSDPQLWLYNETGVLLVSNDDHIGLQSYISMFLEAGTYRLRAGTCCWQPDIWRGGGGWNVQYELQFNGVGSLQTTTTEPTTTTSSTTTTSTSTTTTSTSTSTTTTTLAPTTTTTLPPTTTTVRPTTTTSTSTTSTSTTSTTLEPTTTTTSVPPTTTSSSTTTVISQIATTSSTTTSSTTTTVLPETTTTSSTTTIPPAPIADVVSPKVLDLLTNIASLPAAEIKQAIDSVIADGLTKSDAQVLASNPEIIANVSVDQAKEIFSSVDEGALNNEQGLAIVQAVQNADVKIRKVFETAINVFDGHTDTYVPIGSVINVKQRRVMIIAGLASMGATALPPKRRKNE